MNKSHTTTDLQMNSKVITSHNTFGKAFWLGRMVSDGGLYQDSISIASQNHFKHNNIPAVVLIHMSSLIYVYLS